MAKSETKPSCFIIMPITTPPEHLEDYRNDVKHFTHVLECLFMPSVDSAGFTPVPPKAVGSGVIHADFIKQLSTCEMVLCDMSTLNANVFFELGIRTALNKPVALVVDDKTEKIVPFDTGIINFHPYLSSLDAWDLDKEKKGLEKHIREVQKKTPNYNALWKYFGVAQTGTFKPEDAQLGDKIDFLIKKVSAIEKPKEMTIFRREPVPRARAVPSILVKSYGSKVLERAIAGKTPGAIASELKMPIDKVSDYLIGLIDQAGATDLPSLVDAIRRGDIRVLWQD